LRFLGFLQDEKERTGKTEETEEEEAEKKKKKKKCTPVEVFLFGFLSSTRREGAKKPNHVGHVGGLCVLSHAAGVTSRSTVDQVCNL
jgi:hypothetical protein